MLAEHVFQIERRDPLPAAFDHVLDPVGDLQIALLVDVAHISRVQVSVAPQLAGFFQGL